jgi:uncharacterized YigZ family protein
VNKTNAKPTGYYTIRGTSEVEFTVRKSRFISYVKHVSNREEAQSFLNSIRNIHRDAAHHCFAYRLGEQGLEARMSDDGEPSGSAGKPILFCLQKSNVTNVICVVVRYFGGTKLGIGPLARAYSEACAKALSTTEIEFKQELTNALIYSEFEDVSKVITLLDEYGLKYVQEFSDVVTFSLQLPSAEYELLREQVAERTAGRSGVSKVSA